MYQYKQDLAMAYFDGCSKKTASRLLAREINLTPGLLAPPRKKIKDCIILFNVIYKDYAI